MKHKWECISPSEYDTLYRCIFCFENKWIALDNPDSKLPEEGCKEQAVGVPFRVFRSCGKSFPIEDAPGRYVIMIYGEEYLLDDIVREWDEMKQKGIELETELKRKDALIREATAILRDGTSDEKGARLDIVDALDILDAISILESALSSQ